MKEHRNLAMGSMACGDTGSRILAYRMVRACLCAACAMIAPAHAAASPLLPDAQAVQATDLGVAAGGDLKTITVVLNVVNLAGLEAFVASTADPGSANYRKFLTPSQFAERYGQSDATVMQVLSYLTSMGMKPSRVHGNRLLISVQASNAQIANAFGTVMHNYQVGDVSYQAAVTAPVLPQQIAGAVSHISGLNSKPVLRPHHMLPSSTGAMAAEAKALPTMVPTPNASAATPPGSYTVRDLAQKYNITPLYQAGLTGAGRTVGIVTLAGYLQSDVESYWQALGLQFKPGRIADVMVDGGYQPGDGPGSQDSLETTIDVEQSGGVAPGANLRVYMGPNSNNGLLDTIAQAVDENLVDTLSISWGAPEVTADANYLASMHAVFLQAAAQGIPVIAASGDAGAYDINRYGYIYPYCAAVLTVNHPAADPLVLAAGGTTLPNVFKFYYADVIIPYERPWGGDAFYDYAVKYYGGQGPYFFFLFPVGGGGGVSVNFSLPFYQNGVAGVKTSAPAQSLLCGPNFFPPWLPPTWKDLLDIPAGYAGRNVPDVSLDADPYTGYAIYFNGQWFYMGGGTSFVAPQLAGIFTLISQGAQGRLGMLQPQLYGALKRYGYGSQSPLRAITTGDNLFYKAWAGYNPASGLGTLDVAKTARTFGALQP